MTLAEALTHNAESARLSAEHDFSGEVTTCRRCGLPEECMFLSVGQLPPPCVPDEDAPPVVTE